MDKTYLLPDPQHEYAIALIEVIYRDFGLRPVCLYPSSLTEMYRRHAYPLLRTDRVAASYFLDKMSTAQLAAVLRERHDIVGVIPYYEQGLEPVAALLEHLDIGWNSPAVLRRFRDKHGLKSFLRAQRPDVPVTASRLVADVDAVFAEALPARYVVKPNDGFGNRDIGFFTAATPRAEVAAFFAAHGSSSFLLEEFLAGVEYAVNGQLDHQGRVQIINVTEYERVPANGKPNVYHRTHHVPRSDPAFAPLAAYATQVMEASELRRCPFHMELMLTEAGPRLIEVGARFGGTRYAFAANSVHGGAFDIFALAAHHYLRDGAYTGPGPNWEHYDRVSFVHLDGISSADQRVYRLEGIDAIEALPEFVRWVVKPEVGRRIHRTLDLYTVPYSLHLLSYDGRAAVVAASERAKQLMQINRQVGVARRLAVGLQARAHSLRLRGQHLAARLLARG